MMFREYLLPAMAILVASAPIARGETIDVRVDGVKFVPDIIHAKVGDTISFRSMNTHFVAPVDGMWPDGAPPMQSNFGADYDYRVEREGLYVFKCPPHWGARMGGVMVVGDDAKQDASVAKYLDVADLSRDGKPAKPLLHRLLDQHAARN